MTRCQWCGHQIEQQAHSPRMAGAILVRHCNRCEDCAPSHGLLAAQHRTGAHDGGDYVPGCWYCDRQREDYERCTPAWRRRALNPETARAADLTGSIRP